MEMTPKRSSPLRMEHLFYILLFSVFLLCTLFTILIGSRVYENIRERNNHSYHTDTVLAYVTNKIRQNDRLNSITVKEENDHSILVLTSDYDEILYETWIYQMDGTLWELFAKKDSDLDLSAGQSIMECDEILFSIDSIKNGDTMLTISLHNAGEAKILLRSTQKGGSAE